MAEHLTDLLKRTHAALSEFAEQCAADAAKAADPLLRDALEGLAGQIADRAAQVEAWRFRAEFGVTAEEEAPIREGCSEFLRMVRRA